MIKIYNQNLDILETITTYTSMIWNGRYTDGGSFEFVLPSSIPCTNIYYNNLIKYKDHWGLIQSITMNGETIDVKGFDIKSILDFRIPIVKNYSGSVERVIKNIIGDNTTQKRGFPFFEVETNKGRGPQITYSIDADNEKSIQTILKELCEENNCGYDIRVSLNPKKIQFVFLEPEETPFVYGMKQNNISNFEYELNALTHHNVANGTTTETSEPQGFNRRECVVEESDVKKIKTELNKDKIYENISCDIIDYDNYNKDWKLGDYVTIRFKINNEIVDFKRQITEVQEVHEANNVKIVPTFGEVKESIIRRLIKKR